MSTTINQFDEKMSREVQARAESLAGGLFPHQVEGVAFLLRRHRAILADDMGLGKTRQAIVALRQRAPEGPWLVVCPASVKHNWAREIGLVDQAAPVHVVGPEAPPNPAYRGFVVVNYDILERHREALAGLPFAGFVFDEAHYLKNRTSQRSRAGVALVNARSAETPVYALSGTPLTSRPRDLFMLLNVIRHPMAKSFLSFAKRYCAAHHNGYGWVTDGASNLKELAEQLDGAMLRRTKDEVLDLPPKLRTWVPVEVPEGAGVSEMRAVVQDLVRSVLRQRTGRAGTDAAEIAGNASADRLRLVARVTKARNAVAKAKVGATVDLVKGAVAQGEKVLVFSCFDAPAKTIAKRFGEQAVLLTGATPAKRRQELVDRFQSDESVRVLVANMVAGGAGLNLTAARQVVFNDLDWVPANHWQAEDRIHRIGQTQPTFATYLSAPGTLDEFVARLLEAKAALVGVVERESEARSTMVADLVDASLDGVDPYAAAPARTETRHTVGLLEETLALLQQFAPAGLTEVQQGVSVHTFPSSSSPGTSYTVEVVNGVARCDCPGFSYRGNCRHAREALAKG